MPIDSMKAYSERSFEQAVAWFVALEDECCNEDTRRRFEQWLARDASNPPAYDAATRLWNDLDGIKSQTLPGLDEARSLRGRKHRWQHTAIVLWLGLAGGVGWWLDHRAPIVEFSTGIGERRSIELADGSHIQLNAATQLSVKVSWWRRDVTLRQGQAMFEVEHRRFPAFEVHAGSLDIVDLGTRFDVDRRAGGIEVSVLEGEVALSADGMEQGESLKAGFSRRLDEHGRLQPMQTLDQEAAGAWLKGRLVFDHAPLSEVIEEMERHHAVSFVLKDPDLAKETLSGQFDIQDLKPLLVAIEKILPVKVQRQSNAVMLSRR